MTTRSTAVCTVSYEVANWLADAAQFLREFVHNPRSVAAVVPSGRALASLITSEVSVATGPVLELGVGTGALTRALIERGIPPERLTLVERHPPFAHLLGRRYPGATVVNIDAAELNALPQASFGAIICGLGLLNMSEGVVQAILLARSPNAARRWILRFHLWPQVFGFRCVAGAARARCISFGRHVSESSPRIGISDRTSLY